MKIVIASDSFKGSLDAIQIGHIAGRVAQEVFPGCEVVKIPMADGGEGTVDCLIEALAGQRVHCTVKDPLLRDRETWYGRCGDTAIMEMAAASGITLVSRSERDILRHSTFGTGEMLLHALEQGCKQVFLGIGGSATNDGGMGFAAALGVRFLDSNGVELQPLPENFQQVHSVDTSGLTPLLRQAEITVMSDVTNPLLGKTGATYIFGPQKGANSVTLPILEQGMTHYIERCEQACGQKVREMPGAGAAGGLGAALALFCKAKMQSGVETILEILDVANKVQDADLVITGEGMMDYQSAYGKVASGVGGVCMRQGVPCFAIVGAMGERAEEMSAHGIASIIPTVNGIMPLERGLANAEALYESAARRALNLVKIGAGWNQTAKA